MLKLTGQVNLTNSLLRSDLNVEGRHNHPATQGAGSKQEGSMNSCSDCETQGTCEDSQVLPKMYSCVAHAFREVEPSVNADGMITKKNYVCAHCFLTMSHQQTGGYRGIILYGAMA